jgi:hypothetical protein
MGLFLKFGKRSVCGHLFLPVSGSAVFLSLFYKQMPIRSYARTGFERLQVYEETSTLWVAKA